MRVLYLLPYLKGVLAATVTYNWDVGWVRAAPDGVSRAVIGINGQWPCPTIEANVGDTIVVNVFNGLGNETTGIHFHGMTQMGSGTMDGPSGITQCNIPSGASLTYSFTANPAGTHWYHSHNKGQYPDGFRGPIIIHDPSDPFSSWYNIELTLTLSDWYWTEMPILLGTYLSPSNSEGVEPAPDSNLINDSQNVKLSITPGKTYRLRLINMGAFGVNIQPRQTSSIYITVGQRYDVVFTAESSTNKNYFFVSSQDQSMYGGTFDVTYPNTYGYLIYNSAAPLPKTSLPNFNPIDDFTLNPLERTPILGPVDKKIVLNTTFEGDEWGINRATINGQSYVGAVVPSLYTALSAPANDVLNEKIYGVGANPFVVSYGQIVELVINNYDSGSHPWHMHGHQFQVVYRGAVNTPMYDGTQPLAQIPLKRDVVLVNTNASTVWRFKADNPGVFLIHCHIEWHVEAGLLGTLIEAPDHLQGHLTIPPSHVNVCKLTNTPIAGNAAGNTTDWLNTDGAPTTPGRYDYGSLVTGTPVAKVRRSRVERFWGLGS